MGSEKFLKIAKAKVEKYILNHMDKSDDALTFNVSVVWFSYILGCQKCLISSTLCDGMYYEVTYNASKSEMYLDAYKKFENQCYPIKDGD